MAKQWYEESPARLGQEAAAMRDRFPGFRFRLATNGVLSAEGVMRSAGGASYRVRLVYPPDYPQRSPLVYPVPRLSGPHQYADGAMCLFRPDDRTWTSNSTAATVLAIAGLWLSVREHWQKHGNWLGREHR
jgi:hypothetical protein